ncbi:MAG: hypothetical protein Q9221_004851 [Calogaya cf. arnoldii]
MNEVQPLPNNAAAAFEHGKALMVHQSVTGDEFYTVPAGTADAPAGTLLKPEAETNTPNYMLHPATALSRILYQSESLRVAQRQAQKPVKGYLGAVAVSPITNILELPTSSHDLVPVLSLFATPTMQQLYPDFDYKDVFTEEGWERFQLEGRLGSFTPVLGEVMTGFQALKDNWKINTHLQRFVDRTAAGDKKFGGPLLVIQGGADESMNVDTTAGAVNKIRTVFPDAQLQYLMLP